jgi:hypothetical protein
MSVMLFLETFFVAREVCVTPEEVEDECTECEEFVSLTCPSVSHTSLHEWDTREETAPMDHFLVCPSLPLPAAAEKL